MTTTVAPPESHAAAEVFPSLDTEELARAAALRDRAERLRNQAGTLDAVLANTYRRRAAELELAGWVHEVRSGLPTDQLEPFAA